MGNKALHMNAALLKSKLISKSTKLRLHKSVIKSVVTYARKTWVLKEYSKEKVQVFERKILRKIYGQYREKGNNWRVRRNDELYHIIGNRNITNFIRSQRLRWFEHVYRMNNERTVRKIYKWKPLGT
jgi:hypothetical protein